MRAVRLAVLLLGVVCGSPPVIAADNFPNRPMKFVVGFLAGGPNDSIARIFCDWLQPHLGAPCVVENKVGQGGMIAAKAVIDSPPDGYTFMFVAPNNAIGQSLYKNLPFNHVRDTTPIAGIMQLANIMVVPPSLPVKTVAEFIAYGKANPGKLTFASSGNGTSVHMSGELFKMLTGINMVHVPYRGGAPALTDMISGQVQVMFDNIPTCAEHVKSGKLRGLAVTSTTRSEVLPDLPVLADFLPGYEASAWYGFVAPKNTPADIIDMLNRETNAVLADPAVKKRFTELGAILLPGSPAEFAKLLADETEKWGKVVKFAGAKVD
jgi:tripartite-type tricarboxylate transporter receptor subunit TctC